MTGTYVDLTIKVPSETYKQMQREAEINRISTPMIAVHQLVHANKLPIRQRRMLDLRAQVFDLWVHRKYSGPKIARDLGISLSTVDKHKRAIRDEWKRWAA